MVTRAQDCLRGLLCRWVNIQYSRSHAARKYAATGHGLGSARHAMLPVADVDRWLNPNPVLSRQVLEPGWQQHRCR